MERRRPEEKTTALLIKSGSTYTKIRHYATPHVMDVGLLWSTYNHLKMDYKKHILY